MRIRVCKQTHGGNARRIFACSKLSSLSRKRRAFSRKFATKKTDRACASDKFSQAYLSAMRLSRKLPHRSSNGAPSRREPKKSLPKAKSLTPLSALGFLSYTSILIISEYFFQAQNSALHRKILTSIYFVINQAKRKQREGRSRSLHPHN